MQNLLQTGKYSNKKKCQGKEDRVNFHTQFLRKLKGKEGRKNAHSENGKKKSPSSSNISSIDSTT